MKSFISPIGRRPDGRPETFSIHFMLSKDFDFTIEMSRAMRFHNLLWRTLALCQKHWKTIRPGERLQASVTEEEWTRYLRIESVKNKPPTDELSSDGWAEHSYDYVSNAIDSLSDWKTEIADEVIRDRLESSCCPVCGDSEDHVGDCDLADLDEKERVGKKMAREVMKMHKLWMTDPSAVPMSPLLRYLTAATAYAKEFLEIKGETDGQSTGGTEEHKP